MRELNILAPDAPHTSPLFLEACAGAGKTFTIEHLIVRLLCHPDPAERRTMDQIAVITFTRAAAADLRLRVLRCLSSLADALSGNGTLPDYLAAWAEEGGARSLRQLLQVAALSQERAWIGTIHVFCSRLLRSFGEDLGDLVAGVQECAMPPGQLRSLILDWMRYGVEETLVGRGQWRLLLRKFRGAGGLASALEQGASSSVAPPGWAMQRAALRAACLQCPEQNPEALHLRWVELSQGFKGLRDRKRQLKEEWWEKSLRFAHQVREPTDSALDMMVAEGSPWIEALAPHKLADKAAWIEPGTDPCFDWAQSTLRPALEQAQDTSGLLQLLRVHLRPHYQRWLVEAGGLDPDLLIQHSAKKAESHSWCTRIATTLRTLIVDEFQDTDPQQWALLRALAPHLQLVVVGDPKQSIYAFRRADLYTYLAAQKTYPEEQQRSLTCCYRSSAPLIGAFNYCLGALEGIDLPRTGEFLAIPTTHVSPQPPDPLPLPAIACTWLEGKSRRGGRWPSGEVQQKLLLPAMSAHLRVLMELGIPLQEIAILVKDRYQGATVAESLVRQGIPASYLRSRSWEDTAAMQVLADLVEALCRPSHEAALLRILSGPLAGWPPYEVQQWRASSMAEQLRQDLQCLHVLLMEHGIAALGRAAVELRWHRPFASLAESTDWKCLAEDLLLLSEALGEYEHRSGPLGVHWLSTLQAARLGHLVLAERTPIPPEQAVRILTIHGSKGLEFDAVLLPGLCARPPHGAGDAEADAEKLRTFYVALTRAKRHVWIPWLYDQLRPQLPPGGASPLELWMTRIASQQRGAPRRLLAEELPDLYETPPEVWRAWVEAAPAGHLAWVSHETTSTVQQEPPTPLMRAAPPTLEDLPPVRLWSSFSAMQAQTTSMQRRTPMRSGETGERGAELGVLVHRLLMLRARQSCPLASDLIERECSLSPCSTPADVLYGWVEACFTAPLCHGESLGQCGPQALRAEVPFLLADQSKSLAGWRGVIDLICNHPQGMLLIDWKTHDLGPLATDYAPERLHDVVLAEDYATQGQLYLAAARLDAQQKGRTAPEHCLFVFVRGIALGINAWIAVDRGGKEHHGS